MQIIVKCGSSPSTTNFRADKPWVEFIKALRCSHEGFACVQVWQAIGQIVLNAGLKSQNSVPIVAIAIFKVCADCVEGSGYVIRCGSVGSVDSELAGEGSSCALKRLVCAVQPCR